MSVIAGAFAKNAAGEEECNEYNVKHSTHGDTFETFARWSKQQSKYRSTRLLFLKKMWELEAKKRILHVNQQRIDDCYT